ncbi:MAG: beta-eliminating lyase-related protein [Lachnospiraceae bacterium]
MVEELVIDEGLATTSDCPFKGNFDLDKLRKLIAEVGAEHIPFLRVEAGTNLIGGQPLSLQNMRETCAICREHGIMTVLDASLLQDNLHFMQNARGRLQGHEHPRDNPRRGGGVRHHLLLGAQIRLRARRRHRDAGAEALRADA